MRHYTTVEAADRVPYEMVYPDRVGASYALTHSPRHRWRYFPRMTEDECLLFKVYDSIGGANGQPGGPGRGVIANKHSTDVESTNQVCASV